MFEFLALLFIITLVIVVLWLIQPYKNWKKNFDNRQYEPITITTLNGKKYSLETYLQQNPIKADLSLVVPSYNEEERLPIMLDETARHLKKSIKNTKSSLQMMDQKIKLLK